jgi:hypothetical protein
MAATARASRVGAAPAADDRGVQLEQRVAELESMLTLTLKFATTLAVRTSSGPYSATFREIVVSELRLGQHHDVDKIERWLAGHGT